LFGQAQAFAKIFLKNSFPSSEERLVYHSLRDLLICFLVSKERLLPILACPPRTAELATKEQFSFVNPVRQE